MLQFNRSYYSELVKKYGYVFCRDLGVPISDFSLDELTGWLCAYNLSQSVTSSINQKNTFVTTGIGINRVPHLGTIAQILRAIFFQQKGYRVQIVLGDLDVLNQRGADEERIMKNFSYYHEFIRKLGFDRSKGILRGQLAAPWVMETAFRISSQVYDEDFFDVEEDLSTYYRERGIYGGIQFSVKLAILLMFSDFLDEGLRGKIDHVIVLSGVDEHAYVPKVADIASRLDVDFTVSGLFTPIVHGLNGQPKMSKSLPTSAIWVNMSRDEIADAILGIPDDYERYEDSVIYQIIYSLLMYDGKDLAVVARNCEARNSQWEKDKVVLIERLWEICACWEEFAVFSD